MASLLEDAFAEVAVTDSLAKFVALDKERRKVEDRLDAIKKEQGVLNETLLDEWADRGQQSASVDGLTVYIARDFYCTKKSEVSTEQIIEVLRQNGLEQCVQTGYNATSLKAFVKEQLVSESELPEALESCIKYGTIPRLRTRFGVEHCFSFLNSLRTKTNVERTDLLAAGSVSGAGPEQRSGQNDHRQLGG